MPTGLSPNKCHDYKTDALTLISQKLVIYVDVINGYELQISQIRICLFGASKDDQPNYQAVKPAPNTGKAS